MTTRHLRHRRSLLLGSTATTLAAFVVGGGAITAQAEESADSTGNLDEIVVDQPQIAQAQQTQAEDELADLEEIVVTGSRIARPELEAVSPVISLGALDFDRRGITKVEDELNQLPQVVGSQTSSQSHANSGTATVNLRGLGDQRTLVLKDGKRLPFGSPQSVGPDLNQIPSQLVERVEVLTGGASAVYGADAVAGVVNFVMKDDFEGLEVDFQGSFFQSGNDNSRIGPVLAEFGQPNPGATASGRTFDVTLITGTNFADGRGNVTAWFNYANDNPVRQSERAISSCALGTQNAGADFACVGSTSAFPGRFDNFGIAPDGSPFPRFNLTLDPNGTDGIDADGDGITGLRAFDNLRDTFNFQVFGFFQRPRERFSFGSSSHYEVAENHEFFLDFSFMDNSTSSNIAPSANFFRTTTLNCDNPLLSADQQATFCQPGNTIVDEMGVERASVLIGRRNVEGGPRHTNVDLQTFRVVGGFRGEIWEGVEYEVFGQFAKTDFSEFNTDLNRDRIGQALDVIRDPETGEIRCRDTSGGCVPWDIFSLNANQESNFLGVGQRPFDSNVSQEVIDFLTIQVQTQGETKQTVLGGNINTDLGRYGVQSPFADTPVQTVVGFEYRRDQLSNDPDFAGEVPLAAGFGGPIDPVQGKVVVYEFFGEAQVPIVEDTPGIHELTANAAYRFGDYTVTTGTNHTYTLGVSWAPTPDIRTRTQFARAVRAPNPQELFLPTSLTLFDFTQNPNGFFDPCAGPDPAATQEQCARTGVTPDQFGNVPDNPAGQFNQLQGGNPDLDPEKANTWTVGAIFTPRFAPGLTLTLDWYSIKVKRRIGEIDPNTIFTGCIESGEPVFCDAINRGAGGNLFVEDNAFVESTLINTGQIRTKGVDLDFNYNFDLADLGMDNAGALDFRWIASWIDEFQFRPLPKEAEGELSEILPAQSVKFDCVGNFGNDCNEPRPEFRWRMSTTWRTPVNIDVTATWRYFDSTNLFGGAPTISSKLSSTSFFDLSFNYQIMESVRLRMGVNNLADKDPPISADVTDNFAEGNTFPQTFDPMGRFFFAGLNIQL